MVTETQDGLKPSSKVWKVVFSEESHPTDYVYRKPSPRKPIRS